MSAPAAAVCLVLAVALVLTSGVAFVRSRRKDDPTGGVVGLTAMIIAGFPAAAYGALPGWL
jgi:hypothetical protein